MLGRQPVTTRAVWSRRMMVDAVIAVMDEQHTKLGHACHLDGDSLF
jgi:hypothetical protein